MSKVVSLYAATSDPRHLGMTDLLESMITRARNGEFGEDPRCMVAVWMQDDEMKTMFESCGLTASQAISLCEVVKMRIFNERINKNA